MNLSLHRSLRQRETAVCCGEVRTNTCNTVTPPLILILPLILMYYYSSNRALIVRIVGEDMPSQPSLRT